MRKHSFLGIPLLCLWSTIGHAECANPYSASELGNDISIMSSALRTAKPGLFQDAGASLVEGIPCISDPMAPIILANVYRYAGLHAFFGGKEKEARAWFRSALELDSTFDWDVAELPIDDPIRPIFEMERVNSSAEKVSVDGQVVLKVPEGLRLTADGRPLTKPALTVDRPHLIQSISKSDNRVVDVWLIQGNSLPEEILLQPSGQKVAAVGGVSGGIAVQKVSRSRPPLKTPALVAGGAFMAAGIGLYAALFGARSEFESATTLTSAKGHRATTNTLVLSAAGSFVAGAGLTYVGFMLDGKPGIHFHSKF